MSSKMSFTSSVNVFEICLQINFPFTQLLVPQLQLSFERSYLPIYISKCSKAATQHRCLVLDFFVMSARKATYNKHFIISEYWNQRAVLSLKYFLPIYVMLKFAQELSLTVNTLHQTFCYKILYFPSIENLNYSV